MIKGDYNMKIKNILDFLVINNFEFTFYGDDTKEIQTFAPIDKLKDNSISWARKITNIDFDSLKLFSNLLIIVGENHIDMINNYIVVENPHRVFFIILEEFFNKKVNNIIHNQAVVETNKIGVNTSIGANTFIGRDVIIGDNVVISNNVSIEGQVVIGNNVIVESGVAIGVSGYGHYIREDKVYVRVPHLGGVIIGNHAAIGANTTIARGCLGDTIIEDHVKIDNLCHIAHNVLIKARSMITACTEISGSTIIEEDVWIGPASALINGIVIGENSFLGIGTVVTKDIPKGKVAVGVPARIIRDND